MKIKPIKSTNIIALLSFSLLIADDTRSLRGALKPKINSKEDTHEISTISQLTPVKEPVSQENPGSLQEDSAEDLKETPVTEKIHKQKDQNAPIKGSSNRSISSTLSAQEEEIENKKALDELKKHSLVRFYFENASLENVVDYIEKIFDIKFFADDDIEPTPAGGSILKGHKITFKTNAPLTRNEAWNLFLKFLDIAGLTVVPMERKKFYHITTIATANKEVIPTYFDTPVSDIPDNSAKIRYVFFLKNVPLATAQKILTTFSSSTAQINSFPELNAIIIIDQGSSIRSVMDIIREFDKEVPECMSVLKLKRADAQEVAKLYQELATAENPQGVGRIYSDKSTPDALFFPPGVRVLAEPRTNALILLGTRQAIDKVEIFIKTNIDKSLDMPYSPLYIYELQYTQAENMQRILSGVVDFGSSTAAGQYGGVRDGDQYFGHMHITADTDGNRLIIKAEEADYIKLKEIIKKLDIIQPQVAIEVLIVDVEVSEDKELGMQIRQQYTDQPLPNMQFATSGMATNGAFYQPVMPATGSSLLGNLIALAQNQTPGSTLLSIGSQITGGVWAMLRVLEKFGKTDVISNPFLLTTNGYTAQVQLGTTRRINTSTSLSAGAAQQGFQPINANLTVTIKPQISIDGTIQMGIQINLTDFSSDTITVGNTNTKSVTTAAIVNDREILALGGVVKTATSVTMTKVPILGDIPLFGWLFRNKQKIKTQSNLLIFISPHIVYSDQKENAKLYTAQKTEAVKKIMQASDKEMGMKDPINASFFATSEQDNAFGFLNNMTPHEAIHDAKKTKRDQKEKKLAKKQDSDAKADKEFLSKKPGRLERLRNKQKQKKDKKQKQQRKSS